MGDLRVSLFASVSRNRANQGSGDVAGAIHAYGQACWEKSIFLHDESPALLANPMVTAIKVLNPETNRIETSGGFTHLPTDKITFHCDLPGTDRLSLGLSIAARKSFDTMMREFDSNTLFRDLARPGSSPPRPAILS